MSIFRLFSACVTIVVIRSLVLRSSVIRGAAGLFDNSGNLGCICYGVALGHRCNRHTVFINCPGRFKQGRVGVLGHGQVAAPAELVTERNDFLILQRELAVLVNRTGFPSTLELNWAFTAGFSSPLSAEP